MRMLPICGKSFSCFVVSLAALGYAHAGEEIDVGVGGFASVTNLTFTVVDLDLNDGVAAAYSFNEGIDGFTFGVARTGTTDGYSTIDATLPGPATVFLSEGSASSNQEGMSSHISVDSTGIAASGATSLRNTAFLAVVGSRTQYNQPGFPGYPYTLWITPNTELVVSAFASTFAAVGTVCEGLANLCGNVLAEAGLTGRRIEGNLIAETYISMRSSVAGAEPPICCNHLTGLPTAIHDWGVPPVDGLASSHSNNGFVSITFSNPTAQASSHYLELHANVYANTFTTDTAPIPEPSTYALMLVGIAAVAASARKGRVRNPYSRGLQAARPVPR